MSTVSKVSLLKTVGSNRMVMLGLGAAGGVALIAVLSGVFPRGSGLAKLLLDFHAAGADTVFPYPLTIQNVMWVMLGIAVGEAIFLYRSAWRERAAIKLGLLPEKDSTILTRDNLPEVMEKSYIVMQKEKLFLPQLIHSAGMSFQTHASAEQAHDVMSSQVDLELHRADLRYTLLRYIAWLLPTLGFIGTVVGISAALSAIDVKAPADRPESSLVSSAQPGEKAQVERSAKRSGGASQDVTARLGLAFNTTILALFLSIIVVLLSQFMHKREEEIINAQSEYCLNNLIVRLYNPEKV